MLTWKKFFDVVAFVVVFAVPVILYLMEKAGVSLTLIFVLGWVSIAWAAIYLVLNIPWVWADAPTPIRVWRVCLVSALALLATSYGAIKIWPSTPEKKEPNRAEKSERPIPPEIEERSAQPRQPDANQPKAPSAAEIAEEVAKRTPKPIALRAIMAIARYTQDDGILVFVDKDHPEQGWLLNVWCKNIGEVMAKKVSCRAYIRLIPAEKGIPSRVTLEKYWNDYLGSPVSKPLSDSQAVDLGPNEAQFGTVPLNMPMLAVDPALNSGDKVIFVAGAIWYSDDAGDHKKELCVWGQAPFNPPHLLWHSSEIGHNREAY
jgi:hypothetical protein